MTSDSYSPPKTQSAPIDPARVRRLFARPQRLTESAFLRREIAARMQERLALVRLTPTHVLDAGCGDGADLLPLQKRYPAAQVLGIDAAAAMVQQARAAQDAASSALNKLMAQWLPVRPAGAAILCGDFARLPVGPQSLDLIWSNLALHWHASPDQVFAEWRRVLRVDGLLMFSCFGPDTFKQLRSAFAAVDPSPHILPFVDMHDFGDMLIEAGFSTPVMDMETITVTYRSIDKLLAEVQALGGNPLTTRRDSLTGRQRWQQMKNQLEQLRAPDGTIALTFEVIYGHAFRPAPKTTSRGEAIVRLDFPPRR
ncbi:methyltransferase domain-containing protein [Actimicrobium sp. CCC2.4]|uniref:methyltransferase domain-containing protein n=1 Tax=Actimicrobium sp. CCC2.4 TaxID=3048606 RepID=UPI002AC8CB3E|nr:methyltransferase domain-containing protein [Actimicrobium sp. CCC2.4]MEB0134255.1 methyltransferase domain-containing protein [Actimicrobium sp. CCC2.4]WPX32903.1 methyltransferase domain-containing protein [Actimicrobium sp. CCC2.4]